MYSKLLHKATSILDDVGEAFKKCSLEYKDVQLLADTFEDYITPWSQRLILSSGLSTREY